MRHLLRFALLATITLSVVVPVSGDDSDIFLVDTVAPNVVFLIDSSGSMTNTIDGERKIDSAKRIVNDLIGGVQGVRFGVFRFNGAATAGQIVAPIGESTGNMITLVDSISPQGSTPLGRATQTVQDYFRGLYSGQTCIGNCDGDDDNTSEDSDSDDEELLSAVIAYASPIEYECQKNYAIIVTDGLPNGEAENLVADVATSLFTTDHSPLDGTQNVIVHTVGFAVPDGTDLLTQTATNGGGSFHIADNAGELQQALEDLLSGIIGDSYSFTAPLIPSTGASGGGLGYAGSFEPNAVSPFWTGQLKAYTRDSNGRVPLDSDGQPDVSALAWDAGQQLATRDPATRTIFTVIGGAGQSFIKTNGTITNSDLGVSSSAEKNKLIDFMRGIDSYDGDGDGNTTEQRNWKLGDIFHSKPALVFPPPLRAPDDAYATFQAARQSRTSVLIVGANDGMLHAFRASDGVELWAFIPPDLLDKLEDLTPDIGAHPYLVDGSPVVADVKTGGSWKTIVVFGERRGGTSYHALNITDTTNPSYLWSFTDAEMGETWSTPRIGRVKMASGGEKWVAFVGGGYDTASNNASGRALFAIDLATGTKLWEYKTGGSADAQYMNFSIPSSPTTVDLDGNHLIDHVYVGDVGGQMWKFDVSAEATLAGGLVNNWTGKRLFAAAPSQSNPPAAGEYIAPEAFYGSPTLAYDEDDNLWVFAGTGDLNNPKSVSSNHFFGITDDTSMANGSALTRASLVDATSGDEVTQGWYYALASSEKVLARADVFNNTVFFTTYLPETADVCDAALGNAKLYGLQFGTGLPGIDWPTGETIPEPDGTETPSTDAGGGIPTEPDIILGDDTDTIVVGTTDGTLDETDLEPDRTKRIRYWREVF